MDTGSLAFTLWDVGHGLSIWLRMPNGVNHWIDLGKTPDFSPSLHVGTSFGVREVDYLLISHPDKDHLEDLPNFLSTFQNPRVLLRNGTLPANDMFGEGKLDYQVAFKDLHTRFKEKIPWDRDPTNPDYNGGVEYAVRCLSHGNDQHGQAIEGNNTSLVVMFSYEGVLFVCPGDIEPRGWDELWRLHRKHYEKLLNKSRWRIMVAPHHGRRSAYCKEMMDAIDPHVVLISDVWGESETHEAYRRDPLGVKFKNGSTRKYYSTKRKGRVRIEVSDNTISIDQYDP